MAYVALAEIAKSNIPVLLPDTCILLDILRSPRRDIVDGEAMIAGKSIRDGVVDSKEIGCVIAEQVRNELHNNIQNVIKETETGLQHLRDEIARIDKWAEALGQAGQTQIGHYLTCVPVAKTIMSDIVNGAVDHATSQDINLNAIARMMECRTPAQPGKDSIKDCVVVESYLDVATNLRNMGHTADIVFASSNTKEFVSGPRRKLNEDIAVEFDTLGIKYSRALHETRHLLGLPISE